LGFHFTKLPDSPQHIPNLSFQPPNIEIKSNQRIVERSMIAFSTADGHHSVFLGVGEGFAISGNRHSMPSIHRLHLGGCQSIANLKATESDGDIIMFNNNASS